MSDYVCMEFCFSQDPQHKQSEMLLYQHQYHFNLGVQFFCNPFLFWNVKKPRAGTG